MQYLKQSNKSLKSLPKQRQSKCSENSIEKVVNRYELFLQQKQIIANLALHTNCTAKLINYLHHILSSCWNKIISVPIRASYSQRQLFIQSLKNQIKYLSATQIQNLNQFCKLISQSHCFEEDLETTRKCLCIVYQEQCLPDLIKQLNQSILATLQSKIDNGWSVNMIDMRQKRNQIWDTYFKEHTFAESNETNAIPVDKLEQITSQTINLDSTHIRFKDSTRKFFESETTTEHDSSGCGASRLQPSSYPLIVAVYEGMFNEILAVKPMQFSIQSIKTISKIFCERETFQQQVLKRVEAKRMQRLQEIVVEVKTDNVGMDSNHKIQIQSTKQSS